MKKIAAVVATMLISATLFAAPKAATYTGTWSLDKTKSEGLPKYYDNVAKHELAITQSDAVLQVNVAVTRSGGEVDRFEFPYKLDGTDATIETSIRTPNGLMPVPATLHAVTLDSGELDITIVREFPMNGQNIKARTTEHWKLAADGKTLTIDKVDETPRGTMKSSLVFTKA